MNRVLSAARVQLVAWPITMSWPWAIMLSSLVINVLLFASIGDIPDGGTTGGLVSIYVMTFIASVVMINQDYPFGVALGLTRRAFYAAVALVQAGQAFAFATVLYLFLLVERGTGGWGSGLHFFGIPFLVHDNPLSQILIYAFPFLAANFLGICIALVHKRWNVTGMFALALASVLVLGGLAVLISWQRWWLDIGHWLADQPALGLFAGGPALLALALAGTGYLMIRRTDP